MPSVSPDFTTANEGSVVTFTAQNIPAERFALANLGLADWQWLGPRVFVVAARIASDLASAIEESGWVVR